MSEVEKHLPSALRKIGRGEFDQLTEEEWRVYSRYADSAPSRFAVGEGQKAVLLLGKVVLWAAGVAAALAMGYRALTGQTG